LRISLEAAAKRLVPFALTGIFLLGAAQANAQLPIHKKKKVNKSTSADNQAAPDKILYDRAMDDIKHGRHETGRLNLQTLINTYPDSEYLAKAKLAMADSFYKEGGSANLTQAIQGYKDFGIFFPFLPEAAYAQLQVAMTHYRQMDKPDRDRSQARDAEAEFQTFLQKYPNDPLRPQAEQHLREVQEVLAEGDYRIGYFYYVKGDRRAAAGRLLTVTSRYPLYSRSDRALWMLGDIFEKSEKKDIAGRYYARVVRDYPLSPLVSDCKARLTALKAPVPQADPKAVEWMTAEQNAPRKKTSMVMKPVGLFRGGPTGELQSAARFGEPNLTQDEESLGDILGGGGDKTRLGSSIVATVGPGSGSTPTGTAENTGEATESKPNTDPGAPKPEGNAEAMPPSAGTGATAEVNPTTTATATAPPAAPATGAAASGTAANGTASASDANASGSAATNGGAAASETAQSDKAQSDCSASGQQKGDQKDCKVDAKKESSSKKKKGLKKIVPW
jgi:outer membrane protein assembly factor BamD